MNEAGGRVKERIRRRLRSAAFVALVLAAGAGTAGAAVEPPPCSDRQPGPTENAAGGLTITVSPSGELKLDGGDAARIGDVIYADRLAGVPDALRERLRTKRIAFLRDAAATRRLLACALAVAPDRYGALTVDGLGGDPPYSLRRALIAAGLALVLPQSDGTTCCAALYRAESRARSGRAGVWAAGAGLIRSAAAGWGTAGSGFSGFAIVEGRVRSVGDRTRTLYLNFGYDWDADFTVSLHKPDFSAAQLAPLKGLAGKRVRVRGFLDPWRGGRIPVKNISQIEILEP